MLHQGLPYDHDFDVYPGEYHSVPGSQQWRRKGKTVASEAAAPGISTSISDELYLVETALPGLQREDLLVTIRRNRLLITVRRPREVSPGTGDLRQHAPAFQWQKYTIRLPRNLDTDFISALYEKGRLRIIFPRRCGTAGNYVGDVIVY